MQPTKSLQDDIYSKIGVLKSLGEDGQLVTHDPKMDSPSSLIREVTN